MMWRPKGSILVKTGQIWLKNKTYPLFQLHYIYYILLWNTHWNAVITVCTVCTINQQIITYWAVCSWAARWWFVTEGSNTVCVYLCLHFFNIQTITQCHSDVIRVILARVRRLNISNRKPASQAWGMVFERCGHLPSKEGLMKSCHQVALWEM